jgi:hypothetical protein
MPPQSITDADKVPALIVIVNYRTASLTVECLKSLIPEIGKTPGAEVVVVDNCSGDGSDVAIPEAISQLGIGTWCSFYALPRNGGFAYGNNEAVAAWRAAREKAERSASIPSLIWCLNPDTVVREGALRALLEAADHYPEVGIFGGRSENPDGSARTSAFRFHTPLTEFVSALNLGLADRLFPRGVLAFPCTDHPIKVDWANGASLAIRDEVFDRIGFLDDDYFMYFEETDFCLRAARHGISCLYVPSSRIVHLVGQSSGVTGEKARSRRRPLYWFESRARYFRKNHGALTLQLANLAWLIAYPVGNLARMLRRKPRTTPPLLWWDFLRFSLSRRALR